MAQFDLVAAATAGFRIVRTRPVSVFVWGLVHLLGICLAYAVMIAPVLPAVIAASHSPHEMLTPQVILTLVFGMMATIPIAILIVITVTTALYGAAFRSVLEPGNRGFASLRLSGQEWWLFVNALISTLLLMVVYVALVMVFVAIGGGSIAALGENRAAFASPIAILLYLVFWGLMLWLNARFSLGGPMSFAERGFKLFDSWAVTKGHALHLIAMFLLGFLLFLALYIAFVMFCGVLAVIAMLASGGMGGHPSVGVLAVFGAIGAIGFIYFIGTVFTLFSASIADAYRQLRGPAADAAPHFG